MASNAPSGAVERLNRNYPTAAAGGVYYLRGYLLRGPAALTVTGNADFPLFLGTSEEDAAATLERMPPISIATAADRLKVTTRYLHMLCTGGALPYAIGPNGVRLVRPRDVDAWYRERARRGRPRKEPT